MAYVEQVGRPPAARRVVAQSRANLASRRWAIWAEQQRAGQEPCFSTELRFFCRNEACIWRQECVSLKADWLR